MIATVSLVNIHTLNYIFSLVVRTVNISSLKNFFFLIYLFWLCWVFVAAPAFL